MPIVYTRFYSNGECVYSKTKEVALAMKYTVASEDPARGHIHLHKRESGRTVHLHLYIGAGRDRGVALEVKPGDEGVYLDYARRFLEGLKKAVR
ncbi:MAG: hypothetical protein QFX35_02570 [Candidatus Verstraetearchaeota archaeon]|nr:hypothetical protein [Candidatus Verstraetearchaeota archaeon]